MKKTKIFIASAAGLVLLMGGIVAFSTYQSFNRVKDQVQESETEFNKGFTQSEPKITQDLRLVQDDSWRATEGLDAKELFSKVPTLRDSAPQYPATANSDLTYFLTPSPKIENLEFGWMKSLSGFSYWSGTASVFPSLLYWGRARLFVVRKEKNPEHIRTAIHEVQTFARIIYNSEDLVGGLISVALLQEIQNALAYFRNKKIKITEVEGPSQEELNAMKRLIVVSTAIFHPKNKVETLQWAQTHALQKIGACIGLKSAMDHILLLPIFYKIHHPAQVALISNMIEASQCRLDVMKARWKDPHYVSPVEADETESRQKLPTLFKVFPESWIRNYQQMVLSTVAEPDFYEKAYR